MIQPDGRPWLNQVVKRCKTPSTHPPELSFCCSAGQPRDSRDTNLLQTEAQHVWQNCQNTPFATFRKWMLLGNNRHRDGAAISAQHLQSESFNTKAHCTLLYCVLSLFFHEVARERSDARQSLSIHKIGFCAWFSIVLHCSGATINYNYSTIQMAKTCKLCSHIDICFETINHWLLLLLLLFILGLGHAWAALRFDCCFKGGKWASPWKSC